MPVDDLGFKHKPGCPRLVSMTGAAAIECPHGYDSCPICDPCTCEETECIPK